MFFVGGRVFLTRDPLGRVVYKGMRVSQTFQTCIERSGPGRKMCVCVCVWVGACVRVCACVCPATSLRRILSAVLFAKVFRVRQNKDSKVRGVKSCRGGGGESSTPSVPCDVPPILTVPHRDYNKGVLNPYSGRLVEVEGGHIPECSCHVAQASADLTRQGKL